MSYAHQYSPPRAAKVFTTTGSGTETAVFTTDPTNINAEELRPQFAMVMAGSGTLNLDWPDSVNVDITVAVGSYIAGGFTLIDDANSTAGIELAMYY